MPRPQRGSMGSRLETLSHRITAWSGSSWAFATALGLVVLWAASGSIFHYSDTWQLVINTGTTVVTFLMVFLIQRAQNKDSQAIHLKLDELIAATKGASNRLLDTEDLTERELELLHARVQRLAREAKAEGDLLKARSIEDTEEQLSRLRRSGIRRRRRAGE